jgi:ribonucleoside-diphosphate reductase alpha subunit
MGKPMQVVKRDGRLEAVSFDKITLRISNLVELGGHRVLENVDVIALVQKVIRHVYPGVTTVELDEQTAVTAAAMVTVHPDYDALAGRVCVSNNHKTTPGTFRECVDALMANVDVNGNPNPLLAPWIPAFVAANHERIQSAIRYERDFECTYFGFKTLERGYLIKAAGPSSSRPVVVERPQHMWMRVSIGIHGEDVDAAIETYDLMSRGFFTHATPTLFNSGGPRPQNSSCFLMKIPEDSIKGIYKALAWCADISKFAGGIGISAHDVRASGSLIRGTNGISTGLVPMLRNFNSTARYVNQGSKRKGSIAVYLEPWHPDVEAFLELRKNHGDEESRCRDLFISLWVPDLFMRRVESGGMWSLFCPDECPGLDEAHGEDFDRLYAAYEAQGRARRTMPAAKLWSQIVTSQIETGTPYLVSKDQCNAKSNQMHLGTISSSNLCAEIVEYTAADEIAVCNLASVCLPAFVRAEKPGGASWGASTAGASTAGASTAGAPAFLGPPRRYGSGWYDFAELVRVVGVVVRNLNKVIDVNYYPVEEARNSNLRHRPVGVGVQGLADVFARLRLPFDSSEAMLLNRHIFECIYYGCVEASAQLAEKDGPYSSFRGSPASKGLLQYRLWGRSPGDDGSWLINPLQWKALEIRVQTVGLRNSLLTALMPTASTSQIMGNAESFEPFHGMVAKRSTLAGEFKQVNGYLVSDLQRLGLWSEAMKQAIVKNRGSVQGIEEIPADVRKLYRTVWEIKQTPVIRMAADRGMFVDQSQSMNIYLPKPNMKDLTQIIFKCYKAGLKTWVYYTRVMPGAMAQQVSVEPESPSGAARKPQAEHRRGAPAEASSSAPQSPIESVESSGSDPIFCRLGASCDSCGA